MGKLQDRIDAIRRRSTPVENHLIDEYVAKKISRREFLRRGSVAGMGLPVLGFLAAACGTDAEVAAASTSSTAAATTATTAAGTTATTAAAKTPTTEAAGPITVRVGMTAPAGVIDPVLTNDVGRLSFFGQFAEYLAFSADDGIRPVLAESWEPNADGTVWTFNLRRGVLFNDGTEMTAADVVASMEGIALGNASSVFAGTLSPGGTTAVDDYTVRFELDVPVGSFPFMVSSDNYNAGILPVSFWDSYEEGSFESGFPGTGPWTIESFEPGASAILVRNENYWGPATLADRVEVTFFADEPPMITGFLEGSIDVIPAFSISNGAALLDDPDIIIGEIRTAEHRQVHMATDRAPFDNKNLRQALALSNNRAAMVEGLLGNFGDIGNDHPIAPLFQAFDPSIAQREEDLQKANELVDAAGLRGTEVTLNTLVFGEVELLAQLIQAAAAQIGITINLQVDDAGTYYDQYWLDSALGITNYGHRAVPDVYLSAPLRSDGAWNSAKYNNPDYDTLVSSYIAEADLDAQRTLAGQIQTTLLEDSPIGFFYFLSNQSAVRAGTVGLETTGMGHIRLENVDVG